MLNRWGNSVSYRCSQCVFCLPGVGQVTFCGSGSAGDKLSFSLSHSAAHVKGTFRPQDSLRIATWGIQQNCHRHSPASFAALLVAGPVPLSCEPSSTLAVAGVVRNPAVAILVPSPVSLPGFEDSTVSQQWFRTVQAGYISPPPKRRTAMRSPPSDAAYCFRWASPPGFGRTVYQAMSCPGVADQRQQRHGRQDEQAFTRRAQGISAAWQAFAHATRQITYAFVVKIEALHLLQSVTTSLPH